MRTMTPIGYFTAVAKAGHPDRATCFVPEDSADEALARARENEDLEVGEHFTVVPMPMAFVVCGECEGHGSHLYRACEECQGRRVVAEPDTDRLTVVQQAVFTAWADAEMRYADERRMERLMGA